MVEQSITVINIHQNGDGTYNHEKYHVAMYVRTQQPYTVEIF